MNATGRRDWAVPGMASGGLSAADRLRAATAQVSYRPELLPHPHQVLAMWALHGEDGCVNRRDRARRRQGSALEVDHVGYACRGVGDAADDVGGVVAAGH